MVALALSRVPSPPAVEALVAIAASPARWAEAHAAFSAIRVLTLQAERAGPGASPQLRAILYLAENAAKVTYNASGRPAPFDADAGHWLASNLRVVVERLADAPFEERAWLALTSHLDAVT